jgi:hypothetical protein
VVILKKKFLYAQKIDLLTKTSARLERSSFIVFAKNNKKRTDRNRQEAD